MVQSTFWTLVGPGMVEENWETVILLTSEEVPSGYRASSSASKYSRLYSSPSSFCSVSMVFVFGRRLGAGFPVTMGLLFRELKREKPLPLPRLGPCPLPPLYPPRPRVSPRPPPLGGAFEFDGVFFLKHGSHNECLGELVGLEQALQNLLDLGLEVCTVLVFVEVSSILVTPFTPLPF